MENVFKSIDDKILDNFYKQSADKIIQNLDLIREERKKNSRRWIWELMQNAKDVKNVYGKVSIRIVLELDQLSFSHNGNPFSENDLISLVQQVSAKDSENQDEEVTGKFGTGFISTHLLSDIIDVGGILRRDSGKHQSFNITLDRQAEKSEELAVLIKKTIDTIRQLDVDPAFRPEEAYDENRKEENLDTTFTYQLKDEPSRTAALTGLKELLCTLPLTMVFLDKIKSVTVQNCHTGEVDLYTCVIEKKAHNVIYFYVNRESSAGGKEKFSFIIMSSAEQRIELAIPVNNFDELAICIADNKIPVLYRDFPLIGSEMFYFPFYLNGRSFFPTVDRDGIWSNGPEKKPGHNRVLLLEARKLAIEFTKFLSEQQATNLFVLATTKIPQVLGMTDETRKWFTDYQSVWRSELIGLELVETAKGRIKISELRVPISAYSSKSEDLNILHGFVSDMLGQQFVPRLDILKYWIDVFSPKEEYATWGFEALWNEESILKKLSDAKTLHQLNFSNKTISTEQQKITWLNSFFQYLGTQQQLRQLDAFEVLPNEYSDFRKFSPLLWESKVDPIPDEVLDILKSLNKDWRKDMVRRGIYFEGLPKREIALPDASRQINELLTAEKKEKGVIVYDFLREANAGEVLIAILSLVTENVDKTSFRYQLFRKAKELLGFQMDFRLVRNLNGFSFDNAAVLLVRLVNAQIETCRSVAALAKKLQQPELAAMAWLNGYLGLLEGSKGFNYLLEYGNIVPNRLGELCAMESLYNYGTDDQPLDHELLRILKELDGKQYWLPKLIADGISLKLKKTFKFEELTNQIELFVNSVYSQNSMQPHRNQLLELIEWCNDRKNIELKRRHFQNFESKRDTIFYVLTIKESIYNKQIMEMMKKPEKIPMLVKIAESGISLDQVNKLLDSVKESGGMEKVMKYADELREEKRDFFFKLRIGQSVEKYFQETLEAENIRADIKYIGSGANDFVITNPLNQKQFFIELKSYAKTNANQAITLALSQARKAVQESQRYALCVLERPENSDTDMTNHIRRNLKYLGGLGKDFSAVLAKADTLESIIRDHSLISIELMDNAYSVKVAMLYIDARQHSFQDLIIKIKTELG